MIPKIIHYCWFGGNPLPELAQKCIASWKKHCPDYEIREWNESNFDVTSCDYAREAYEAKKWAFVTDYARLAIIYEYGGVYLDTDVELISSLNQFLDDTCFMGIEKGNHIATGLGFGSVPKNQTIKELLELYNHISFYNSDGTIKLITCPIITTDHFIKKGFLKEDKKQVIENVVIYPSEFFCPLSPGEDKCVITDNTISIHHYSASWIPDETLYIQKLKRILLKKFTERVANRLSLIIGYTKYRGFFNMPFALINYKINNLKRNKTTDYYD